MKIYGKFNNEINESNVLAVLSDNCEVKMIGRCQWRVSTWIDVEGENSDVHTVRSSFTTNDENVKYGIMDGEKYNPLCGFSSMEELQRWAAEDGLTAEDVQRSTWMDSANDDNYESADEKYRRLAGEMLEDILEQIENL